MTSTIPTTYIRIPGVPCFFFWSVKFNPLHFMFCWPCILVRRWVNDQLDVQLRYNNNNYYYYYYYYYYHYYYYNPLNVSSNSVLIIRRSNLINTTSGIVFCVSDSPLCRLRRNYTRCCINTGLFEITVGVLTTCHTQYTSDSSICIFLFNRTTLTVFVTYLTGALYVHPLWLYRVIQNDCLGFNNLSYTIHLR